jgi:hypothetical protein
LQINIQNKKKLNSKTHSCAVCFLKHISNNNKNNFPIAFSGVDLEYGDDESDLHLYGLINEHIQQ